MTLKPKLDRLGRVHNPQVKENISDSRKMTPRRLAVLQAYADGKSGKEIAGQLNVSTQTIDAYYATIKEIMGVKSIRMAMVVGLRDGLLSFPEEVTE